jgi:hypothetical protein
MAIQKFRDVNLRQAALDIVSHCNTVIKNYQQQGLRLTLRQLYYQCVTVNLFPNSEKSYKRLSTIVSDARLAGLMDWDAIEDRVRQPRSASEWDNLADLVEGALWSYRLPRWEGQDNYVELWVEKDALAGVLAPIANRWHVTMMVNRGYSSQSAMYESAQRFLKACYQPVYEADSKEDAADMPSGSFARYLAEERGLNVIEPREDDGENPPLACVRQPVLLYLGDHDPSGEDMVRDIRDRLQMFGIEDITVTKIALTMTQVKKYAPPPNPAKITDPRAKDYIAQHGAVSWEVDALPPNVLTQVIEASIKQYVDVAKMDAIKLREEEDKKKLRAAVKQLL